MCTAVNCVMFLFTLYSQFSYLFIMKNNDVSSARTYARRKLFTLSNYYYFVDRAFDFFFFSFHSLLVIKFL